MNKLWGRFGFIFLFFLLACGTTQEKKDIANLHLSNGVGFFQKGNYPAAMREFLLAKDLDPSNPFIHNNLGLAYFVRKKYDLAAQHVREAISLDSNYADARNNLGRILVELKQYDEAIKILKVVVNDLTYTQPEKAHFNLGLAYFESQNYKEAFTQFTKSLEYSSSFCLSQYYYGRTLYELHKFRAANIHLDKAAALCKADKFDEPLFYSAVSYYKSSLHDLAKARLQELLELYPDGKYYSQAQKLLKSIEQ